MVKKILFLAMAVFLLCCGPRGPVCLAAPVSDEQEELAHLSEGAKKEGTVSYYTSMTLSDAVLMAKAFEKKYPFIKVEIFRMTGEKLLVKALAEARYKSLKADVYQSSIVQVSQMKQNGLLMKYAGPASKSFPAKFRDHEGFWNATYLLPMPIVYNTKLVAPLEAPRTYEDLLNQKWKGKIGLETEEIQWFFHMLKIMGREKGGEYMKRLARQDLLMRKGHPILNTLCTAGEIPLLTADYLDTVQKQQAEGAPLAWVRFASTPIITQINAISLVADAPHPQAAKLFYNFVLSREGAKIFREVKRIPANPDEQPQSVKGLNLYVAFPDELLANYQQVVKEWNDIFHK